MSENILEIRNIDTFIGQFHILEGVNAVVPKDGITVLLGRNGAGKTTTLRSVMGLTPPSNGEIIFDGISLRKKPTYSIASLGIGYVPENRIIFRNLSVVENLKLAEHKKGDFERSSEMIFDLFPDLKRLYKLGGGQLSGGQQQMLTIARALVPENRLLLIDEPSEGLAPVLIEQMMDVIRQLREHTTVLLVEQNFRMASRLADSYVIIDEGHSVHNGMMADLLEDKELIRRYLGAA